MRREQRGASRGNINAGTALFALCVAMAGCSFDPSGTAPGGDAGPVPTDASNPNSHRCICDCVTGDDTRVGYAFQICYDPAFNPVFNPALPDDYTPTPGQLTTDCRDRLEPNIEEFSDDCGPTELRCTCFIPGGDDNNLLFAAECNEECEEVELNDDTCSNFDIEGGVKEATNVPGEEPVCLVASADPPNPTPDPLAAALFGQRTRCEVTGEMTVDADGDERTVPASGIVELTGKPCPGASCTQGMYFELRANPVEYSGLFGLVTVRLDEMRMVGSTQPGAVAFDPSGFALVAPGMTLMTARGRRTDSDPFGDDVSTGGFLSSNPESIAVSIDWQNGTCAMTGTLLGTADDEVSVGATVDLTGTILNQPPEAQASSPPVVECTSPAGALITLDGSGSTDPDSNLAALEWRAGSRAGAPVGSGAMVTIVQALNTTTTYVLQVMDTFMQADGTSVTVSVVDTTAPTITAVGASPHILWPPNHRLVPIDVSVAASDVCGATTCSITEVTSNQPESGPGSGNTSPDWEVTGPLSVNLRAERRGGSTRVYTIEVECSDAFGNSTTSTTTVTVPRSRGSSAKAKTRRRRPR